MKKAVLVLVCVIAMYIFSFKAFGLELIGNVEFGPYINCKVVNGYAYPVNIQSIVYRVEFTNGAIQDVPINCSFNCLLLSGNWNKFSGPSNSTAVRSASCIAFVSPAY
jgi:hypothetical protein